MTGINIDGRAATVKGRGYQAGPVSVSDFTILDDWEDNDLVPKNSSWSYIEIDGGSVVSSPALAGSYSGEAAGNTGNQAFVGQRDTVITPTAASTLARLSTLSEQGGTWAIGKITGSPTAADFWNQTSEYAFISRVESERNTGEIDLVGTTTNIGTISANTNYKILWENIDFSAETYDITITRVSDGTTIASVTGEPFADSTADMDFFGFGNGQGGGGFCAAYADNIKINTS
jgi:beta-galactosidase GanA